MPRCWPIRTMVLMMEAAGYAKTSVSALRTTHVATILKKFNMKTCAKQVQSDTHAHTLAYISHRLAERICKRTQILVESS